MVINSTNPSLRINAIVDSKSTGSFVFQLTDSNGTTTTTVENTSPFALCTNKKMNFSPCDDLGFGKHIVGAKACSKRKGRGRCTTPLKITFQIERPVTKAPVAMTAPNKSPVAPVAAPVAPATPVAPTAPKKSPVLLVAPVAVPVVPVAVPVAPATPIAPTAPTKFPVAPGAVPVAPVAPTAPKVPIDVPVTSHVTPFAPLLAPRAPVDPPATAPITAPLAPTKSSSSPSSKPSKVPSSTPTNVPSGTLTNVPSSAPTKVPSSAPTGACDGGIVDFINHMTLTNRTLSLNGTSQEDRALKWVVLDDPLLNRTFLSWLQRYALTTLLNMGESGVDECDW